MATLVGFVVARNPVIRRVVVPTNDRELDDPKMLKAEERMMRVPVATYEAMDATAMSLLEQKLKALLAAGYEQLDAAKFTTEAETAITEAAALAELP